LLSELINTSKQGGRYEHPASQGGTPFQETSAVNSWVFGHTVIFADKDKEFCISCIHARAVTSAPGSFKFWVFSFELT
jgi:hypothetical protein